MTEQVTRTEGQPAADTEPERSGAAARDVVTILGAFLLLGVVCAVLWWLLFDPAVFTKLRHGGSMGEVQLAKQFNADGWYVVIGAVAGFLAGVLLTWWRSRDYLLTTALVTVGSVVAAGVMEVAGRLLGPGNPDAALAVAKVGAHVPVQLSVSGTATYLVWPIASLVGAVMVLWSSSREAGNRPPAERSPFSE